MLNPTPTYHKVAPVSIPSICRKAPEIPKTGKMRAFNNADELLAATRKWIGEEAKHQRRDDIVEFARGSVNFRVAQRGYTADVVVGIRENGSALLYDVVNITSKNIEDVSNTGFSNSLVRRDDTSSINTTVPQNGDGVNSQFMQEGAIYADDGPYSIQSLPNGIPYVEVDVDQSLFDGLSDLEKLKMAELVIRERFVRKVIGDEYHPAYVNVGTAKEYAHPAKFLKTAELIDAKARASTELDNLLKAATNWENHGDGENGHQHPEAIGGFDHATVLFKVGNTLYQGQINVEIVAQGRLLKDITQIREAALDDYGSYENHSQPVFQSDSSNTLIPQNGDGVNSQFMQEGAIYAAGRYDRQSDTVLLNPFAGEEALTGYLLAHELTHSTENTMEYRTLATYIRRMMGEEAWQAEVTAMAESRRQLGAPVDEEGAAKEHNKFNYFCYYRANVCYQGETFPLYLNVGKGKADGQYHLYDITNKIRDTADRINGLERPKPNEGYALTNGVSSDSISNPDENVKGNSENGQNAFLVPDRQAEMDVAAKGKYSLNNRFYRQLDAWNQKNDRVFFCDR